MTGTGSAAARSPTPSFARTEASAVAVVLGGLFVLDRAVAAAHRDRLDLAVVVDGRQLLDRLLRRAEQRLRVGAAAVVGADRLAVVGRVQVAADAEHRA